MKFTLEQKKHLAIYLNRHPNESLSYAKIAFDLKLPTSDIRYLLTEMEKEGLVNRVIKKAYNKHYIRYAYSIPNLEAFINSNK